MTFIGHFVILASGEERAQIIVWVSTFWFFEKAGRFSEEMEV